MGSNESAANLFRITQTDEVIKTIILLEKKRLWPLIIW